MAYSLKHINELAKNDAKAFVEGTEAEFQRKLELAAKRIAGNRDKSHIILLSGPSASNNCCTILGRVGKPVIRFIFNRLSYGYCLNLSFLSRHVKLVCCKYCLHCL